jgi:Ca-activated chloride channel homolog
MQSLDNPNSTNPQTRLDKAKKLAFARINAMNSSDRMMLVSVANNARTVQPWTEYKERLLRAVRNLKIEQGQTKLDEAILLAAATLRTRAKGETTQLVILSDGAANNLRTTPLDLPQNIIFQKIGASDDNLAITRLSLQSSEDQKAGQWNLFLSIENFSSKNKNTSVSLQRDNKILAVRKLTLKAGETHSSLFRLGEIPPGPIEIQLNPLEQNQTLDALELDNHAFAVIPPNKKSVVLLISPEPSLLQRAFSVDERIEVRTQTKYTPKNAAGACLIVFQGSTPPAPLPSLPCLFINPTTAPSSLKLLNEFGPAVITGWNRQHRLLRYVDPRALAIRKSRQIALPQQGQSLIEVNGRTIIASFTDREIEHVIIAFDLHESNWPRRLSFPIFLRNLVSNALELNGRSGHPYQLSIGEVLPLRTHSDKTVTVKGPNNKEQNLPVKDGLAYFTATHQSGIYQITQPEGNSYFGVNLFDRQESNIKGQNSLKIGRKTHQTRSQAVQRPVFRPFLLLAFLILLAEFAVWKYRL